MMTMLYSINLRIMGKSNLSVFGSPTCIRLGALPAAGLSGQQDRSRRPARRWPSSLRSTCSTGPRWALRSARSAPIPDMAEAQGINVWVATIGGVGLAGAFSATSGALMVQSQGFADVNMGLGILINGLAALMIGEAIVGKQTVQAPACRAVRRRHRLLPARVAVPGRRHAAA
jgi:putative ABC transport system permease protein